MSQWGWVGRRMGGFHWASVMFLVFIVIQQLNQYVRVVWNKLNYASCCIDLTTLACTYKQVVPFGTEMQSPFGFSALNTYQYLVPGVSVPKMPAMLASWRFIIEQYMGNSRGNAACISLTLLYAFGLTWRC